MSHRHTSQVHNAIRPFSGRTVLAAVTPRVVAIQLAALIALAAGAPVSIRGAVGAIVALLIAVAALSRVRGHSFAAALAVHLRFRRRRRREPPTGAPLETLLPDLHLHTHPDRGGNRIGLAGTAGRWTAVLRVQPPDRTGVEVEGAYSLVDLLRRTARATTDPALMAAATQVVTGSGITNGEGDVPAWLVAVGFAAERAPFAVLSRGCGVAGARRSAAVAGLRFASQLHDAGYRVSILDGEELRTLLVALLGLDPAGRPDDNPRSAETWRAWSVGTLHHACYRPRRTPHRFDRLAELLQFTAAEPAVSTWASVSFRPPTATGVPTRVVTRIAVSAEPRPASVDVALSVAATQLARSARRTDGEHAAGVRASLPLAADG